MKSFPLVSVVSFVVLVLAQVMVFNHLHVFKTINPIIYLLFFVFYRFESNQTLLIALSFLMGFSIDLLSQSGGAHTIATLTIGFIRPFIIRYAFGNTMETPQSYFSDNRILNKLIYLVLLVLLHQLLYFIIVFYSIDALYHIVKNTLLTSIISLILMGITISFYPTKK